jgi:hypothetical protein
MNYLDMFVPANNKQCQTLPVRAFYCMLVDCALVFQTGWPMVCDGVSVTDIGVSIMLSLTDKHRRLKSKLHFTLGCPDP